jgi:hypothetical protein
MYQRPGIEILGRASLGESGDSLACLNWVGAGADDFRRSDAAGRPDTARVLAQTCVGTAIVPHHCNFRAGVPDC